MPRSPSTLTVASFLKKPPDKLMKIGKVKKRKLSLSPSNTNNDASSKKSNFNESPQALLPSPVPCPLERSPLSSPLTTESPVGKAKVGPHSPPLHPYQLRDSLKKSNKKFLTAFTSLSSSSPSRMDDILLETGELDACTEALPTSEEADELLRDDPQFSTSSTRQDNSAPSSPTAAVKSAIEAQIAENLVQINSYKMCSIDSNKEATIPTPLPSLPPLVAPPPSLKKTQPLFPEGLPPNCLPNPSPASSATLEGTKARHGGYFTAKGNDNSTKSDAMGNLKNPNLPKSNSTYASKAKTPPKRVMVENILFVYSTWTNKAPIGAADWGIVDSHLLAMELRQDPSDPLIRIANSGYDATHRCGFIACKDLASADWCKRTIRGIGGSQYGEKGAFRAWSKGEQPESRLCRLFFPSRFDSLDDFALELSLLKHNPPLKQGTVTVKGMDDVQNGRALFIEVDIDSYAYIKSKGFKVEFPLMDIDCQLYIPPQKKRVSSNGPGISGISKLDNPQQSQSKPQKSGTKSAASSVALSTNSTPSVSSPKSISPAPVQTKGAHPADPRLSQRALPPLSSNRAPTLVRLEEQGKRSRPDSASFTDAAKKPHSNINS